MEDLINDSSFEIFHNSEGARILGWDRTLMKYPNERNSFDVFMGIIEELNDKQKVTAFQNYVINVKKDNTILGGRGADGLYGKNTQKAWDLYGEDYKKSLIPVDEQKPKTEDDKKPKTEQELKDEKIKQYASIGKDVIQTGQAVGGAVASFQSIQKKKIKELCGRKPLGKKNREIYDKCVQNYIASITPDTSGEETGGKKMTDVSENKPKSNNNKYIIAGVIVLGLIGGFLYLKKTGKI